MRHHPATSSDRGLARPLTLALVLAAAACGDGQGGPTEPTPEPSVASISVTPEVDTLFALGDRQQFTAVARDGEGNLLSGVRFTWSSTDGEVATVDTSGLAEAVGNGEAEIRASADGVTGASSLTISQRVSAVSVSPDAVTLEGIGATQEFTASATDANGNQVADATFLWQSERQRVATVDSAGVATAEGEGETTITAAAQGVPGHAVLRVERVGDAVLVTAGEFHTCGLTDGGEAYCWGHNTWGAVGDGTTADRHEPVAVAGELAFDAVDAGEYSTCGLTGDGEAYCWGANDHGQLGDGTTTDRTEPVQVRGGLQHALMSLGRSHTCAVTADETGYCWGWNYDGQVGDGTRTSRSQPVPVEGGLELATVDGGGGYLVGNHTCGATAAGDAYCWGLNSSGQLGDGAGNFRETTPVPVSGDLAFAMITAGGLHTCGVTTTGDAYCWGANGRGQLGVGTAGDTASTPVAVRGGLALEAITAGRHHTCGLSTDGTAYCWGRNDHGQLGDGTAEDRAAPVAVAGGHTFRALTAGGVHTCGLSTDGFIYCWGANGNGQLGNGGTGGSFLPTRVELP